MRYGDYLSTCQQQFAATTDAQLRAFITEFSDHKMTTTRKVQHEPCRVY